MVFAKRFIGLMVILLGLGARSYAQLPETVTWKPLIKMDKHLFPSYLIAGATMRFEDLGEYFIGEPKGMIGIKISSTYRFAKFKLEIRANEIADPTFIDFTLPHDKRREDFYVFPNINYRFLQLKSITQPIPVNVNFILYIDGKEESQQTETINVHSINDCPYQVINADSIITDMNWMFGAYVNENHPMIEEVLHEAVNTHMVDQFTDYALSSESNKDELFRQVLGVWTALYNRKITYSNTITPSLGTGKNISSQRVRFFDQALNSAQANCVDGSVMFASIFRRIGIEPFLVLVPDHCYMGFYTSTNKTAIYCLETTVIGKKNVSPSLVDSNTLKYFIGLYPKEVAEKNKDAIVSFAFALKVGQAKWTKDREKITEGNKNYLQIDIAKSRAEEGIIPISD